MGWIPLYFSSLIPSSAFSSLLLNLSHVFFSSIIAFFNSVTSIWHCLLCSASLSKSSLFIQFSPELCEHLWLLLWTLYQVQHSTLLYKGLVLRFYPCYFIWSILLFLSFASLSLLISMHEMKQPPLPILKKWPLLQLLMPLRPLWLSKQPIFSAS